MNLLKRIGRGLAGGSLALVGSTTLVAFALLPLPLTLPITIIKETIEGFKNLKLKNPFLRTALTLFIQFPVNVLMNVAVTAIAILPPVAVVTHLTINGLIKGPQFVWDALKTGFKTEVERLVWVMFGGKQQQGETADATEGEENTRQAHAPKGSHQTTLERLQSAGVVDLGKSGDQKTPFHIYPYDTAYAKKVCEQLEQNIAKQVCKEIEGDKDILVIMPNAVSMQVLQPIYKQVLQQIKPKLELEERILQRLKEDKSPEAIQSIAAEVRNKFRKAAQADTSDSKEEEIPAPSMAP